MRDSLPLLAAIRVVVDTHAASPRVLLDSIELERRTADVARAAHARGMPFAALCAELGRIVIEALPHDRGTAIEIGQAMTRWAARAYRPAGMA
jgi:hypothetical protein